MTPSGLTVEVGQKTLEFSYMYGLALLTKHTVALTLAFVAADSSAYSREIAPGIYYGHGIAEIAFGELCDPFGDVVVYGASFLAARHLAVETALCLFDGFVECIINRTHNRSSCFYCAKLPSLWHVGNKPW